MPNYYFVMLYNERSYDQTKTGGNKITEESKMKWIDMHGYFSNE